MNHKKELLGGLWVQLTLNVSKSRRAYHHNGDAMLKHANVRKYRRCHAFPTLFAQEGRQTRVMDR